MLLSSLVVSAHIIKTVSKVLVGLKPGHSESAVQLLTSYGLLVKSFSILNHKRNPENKTELETKRGTGFKKTRTFQGQHAAADASMPWRGKSTMV